MRCLILEYLILLVMNKKIKIVTVAGTRPELIRLFKTCVNSYGPKLRL